MRNETILTIQASLARDRVDGWLFRCFQTSDPVSQELLGLPENLLITRRCYYLIPREGEPRKLAHLLEPAMLDKLPGETSTYLTWREHRDGLIELVRGCRRLAAQYSPECALPSISRLDAGTAEILRGTGIELLSAGELVQEFAAVWSPDQLAGHRRACRHLHEIVKLAFDQVSGALFEKRTIDEHAVQNFILEQFETRGLWSESEPIVAVNAHSADPHYQPGPNRTSPIHPDDFLLIDLWAKEKRERSVYADICWCGVCATHPTERQADLFGTAVKARDAALELVKSRWPELPVQGFEVDDAARAVIEESGFGKRFIHRTGHSIGVQDHGQGANMDNLETHDTRRLRAMTGFSIEPGIYLPGDFGVRTEINVVLTKDQVEVTGGEPQKELVALL